MVIETQYQFETPPTVGVDAPDLSGIAVSEFTESELLMLYRREHATEWILSDQYHSLEDMR